MNMVKTNIEKIKEKHPCFSNKAHFRYGRVHLPVAPKCNIQCRYCVRSINSFEDRPGVTEKIISPLEAIEILRDAVKQDYPLTVVAVAGPGEPLANQETFEVLEMARQEFPHLIRCIATNGLALREHAELLEKIGIRTVTVTVNAISPEIGAKVYDYVKIPPSPLCQSGVRGDFHASLRRQTMGVNGRRYTGKEAAGILINRQQEGVKEVISLGMVVKINTVFIPDINGDHMIEIAKRYAELGANIMNIVPLIPVGKFAGMRPPTHEELSSVRLACGEYIEQFTKCKQCRADACGVPGWSNAGGRLAPGSPQMKTFPFCKGEVTRTSSFCKGEKPELPPFIKGH